jgi:hypothetical protein
MKKELESGNLQKTNEAMTLKTSEETMMKIAYDLSTTRDDEMFKLQQAIVTMVGVDKYNEWIEAYDEQYHK